MIVFNDIFPGYLDYMKKLGYTMAHIWACPPSEGDDYIFHSHPPDQKIPKPKRLQEWYKKMLDKGIIERIVLDYKDIYKQALEDNIQSPAELPYFEGDFWPNVMEENIRELEQEEEARKRVSNIFTYWPKWIKLLFSNFTNEFFSGDGGGRATCCCCCR